MIRRWTDNRRKISSLDVGITVNRNAVPWVSAPSRSHLRPANRYSGRSRPEGSEQPEFTEVADVIATALVDGKNANVKALSARIHKLTEQFPLYEGLNQTGAA